MASRGSPEAWLAGALLLTLMLDAITRSSFTAFPTAYVAMLMIGVALAAGTARVAPTVTSR